MPLSKPNSPRELLHTRTVICRGYRRADGLWDIEGQMTDVKSYGFPNQDRGGWISAGEPLHGMWLRLTLDDHLTVVDAEASTDHAPFAVCPRISERYRKLVGLRIAPGWNRKVKELFAGVQGCTHLTELLGPVATTAIQTLHSRSREDEAAARSKRPPRFLDTCHALASDGEVVKREWPQFYTGEQVTETARE
ncbi:MAG TPA: DUF2889 domain-containing protein [Candidatus Competibacteraceae bacterium]|nr:DUF2889 domain-containing protein [Candidatus Competibacteraceae bacterium]